MHILFANCRPWRASAASAASAHQQYIVHEQHQRPHQHPRCFKHLWCHYYYVSDFTIGFSSQMRDKILLSQTNFLREKKWDRMFLSREIKIFNLKLTFWERKKWENIIWSREIKIFYLNLSAEWKVAAWTQNSPKHCYRLNQSIDKCVEENSLNSSDLVKGILLGYEVRSSLNLTKEMVTEDSTQSWHGRYFTLNLPLTIGPDDDQDQLYIFVSNISLEYQLFVHDPKFFIYSDNILLPMEIRTFNTRGSKSSYFRLNLIEMNELNVPSDPCNTNPDFNFRVCVKKSVTEKVQNYLFWHNNAFLQIGCTTRWDPPSTQGMEACTKSEQFR